VALDASKRLPSSMKTVRLLQSCLVIGLVRVSCVLADPSTYFGGADHDVYMDWITNDLMVGGLKSRYPHSFFLSSAADTSLGMAVHYRLDEEKSFLRLALAARANGWLSFGHSENGGMSGSDILIYEAANPDVVIDAYVLEERQPIVDDCASNWILHSSKENFDNGFIMIEVSRTLVTGDLQDRSVLNDTDLIFAPHRVIAAWGDEPNYGYHGLVNRARSSVRWFSDNPDVQESFSDRMETDADGFFELRASDYAVKPIETEYAEFCFDYDDLIVMGVPAGLESMSMIAFEAIIDQRALKHVQ
jgi:DOMON domain